MSDTKLSMPLDGETERLIEKVARDQISAPDLSALRDRVRELLERARREGYRKAERMYFDD